MGIKGLRKAIVRYAPRGRRQVQLGDLKGLRAAVDTSIFVYKLKAAGADPADGIQSHVEMMRCHGIHPFYFLDGPPCKAKSIEIANRRKSRQHVKTQASMYKKECETITKLTASTPQDTLRAILAIEKCRTSALRREAAIPSKTDFTRVQCRLKELGVPVYQSKNDAEKACAWAIRCGMCDVAISEDYDTIPYGAARLITGFPYDMYELDLEKVIETRVAVANSRRRRKLASPSQTRVAVANSRRRRKLASPPSQTRRRLARLQIKSGFGFDHATLVDYCILLGSDLCPSRIVGIGAVAAKRMLGIHESIEGILKNLPRRLSAPADFGFQTARDEFLDHTPQAIVI